jgi:formamidopyrimidine-DNA glycosylase
MPELPEVELIRAALQREFVGKKIKAFAATNASVVPRHKAVKDVRALIEGRAIKNVARLGLYLIFQLDNGLAFVATLGPTGSLAKAKTAKEVKPKHTRAELSFSTGEELRFVDVGRGVELFVSLAPSPEAEVVISKYARLAIGGDGVDIRKRLPELAMLGIDPFEDQLGWDRFAAITRSRTVATKTMLLDQEVMSGIGNVYADEILFAANIRFDRPASALSTIEIRRLHRTIPEVMTEAMKAGGVSLEAAPFVNIDGKAGTFQNDLQVAGRDGQPCVTCRTPISKVAFEGVATYFCPKCQQA